MPVAVEMNFKGATLDQYDKAIELMGFTPGGAGGEGGLFHWVTATSDGIRVVDVWENKKVFEEFAETKIGPLTQEAGFSSPPEIAFYDVHNYLTGPA